MRSSGRCVGPHAARRGAGPHIAEHVTLRAVMDEVDRSVGLGIDADAGTIQSFCAPQREELLAELVVAEPRDVRHLGALAHGRDRRVHGVAAEALQVAVAFAGDLAEFVHRLAEGDDVEWGWS